MGNGGALQHLRLPKKSVDGGRRAVERLELGYLTLSPLLTLSQVVVTSSSFGRYLSHFGEEAASCAERSDRVGEKGRDAKRR